MLLFEKIDITMRGSQTVAFVRAHYKEEYEQSFDGRAVSRNPYNARALRPGSLSLASLAPLDGDRFAARTSSERERDAMRHV